MGYAYDPATTRLYVYDLNDAAGGHAPGFEMSPSGAYAYMNAAFPGVMANPLPNVYTANCDVRMGYAAGMGFTNDPSGQAQTTFRVYQNGYAQVLRFLSTYQFTHSGGTPGSKCLLILGSAVGSGSAQSGLYAALIEQVAAWTYYGNIQSYNGAIRATTIAMASELGMTHEFYDSEIEASGTLLIGTYGAAVGKFYRCEFRQSQGMVGTSMFHNGLNVAESESCVFVQKWASYWAAMASGSNVIVRKPRVIFATNPANAYFRTTSPGGMTRSFLVGFPYKSGIWRFDQTYASIRSLLTSLKAMGASGNAHDLGIYRPRVVDASGNAVAGARVKITNSRPASIGGPTVEVDVLTDANGNCTWTPLDWLFLTPLDALKDSLYLGAYWKKPANPGASPNYDFTGFGPFTVEVTHGADKVTRALPWPTSQAADAYGWYPVAEVYDVIVIPGPAATSPTLYFQEMDIPLLIEDSGQEVSVGPDLTKGYVHRLTRKLLIGEMEGVLATDIYVFVKTGSLPLLTVGVQLGADGEVFAVREFAQIGDGALTQILCAEIA